MANIPITRLERCAPAAARSARRDRRAARGPSGGSPQGPPLVDDRREQRIVGLDGNVASRRCARRAAGRRPAASCRATGRPRTPTAPIISTMKRVSRSAKLSKVASCSPVSLRRCRRWRWALAAMCRSSSSVRLAQFDAQVGDRRACLLVPRAPPSAPSTWPIWRLRKWPISSAAQVQLTGSAATRPRYAYMSSVSSVGGSPVENCMRGDDRRREPGGEPVFEAEHDDRQPQRIGIGRPRADEELLEQQREREQQRELDGRDAASTAAAAARRGDRDPGGPRSLTGVSCGHVVARLDAGHAGVGGSIRGAFRARMRDGADRMGGRVPGAEFAGASRCTSQMSLRAAGSSSAIIMRMSRAAGRLRTGGTMHAGLAPVADPGRALVKRRGLLAELHQHVEQREPSDHPFRIGDLVEADQRLARAVEVAASRRAAARAARRRWP